jgi:hypothetical protein
MDLVLCHHRGSSCVVGLTYHEIESLGLEIHARNGERVTLLVVFFGHGARLESVKESLADVPKNKHGWLLTSPGEITYRIQAILAPGSVVNIRNRAVDKVIQRCGKNVTSS